ncbi:MAG: DUF4349 domain-containing protein [Caulobacteraceae bacterium]
MVRGPGGAASEAASAPAASQALAKTSPPAAQAQPVSTPMLAYRYSATLEAPGERLRALMGAHEAACSRAGPALCQVIGAEMSSERGELGGALKLRAQPQWLAKFRAGLDGDARGAGGRVARSGVETEDLTRSIIDTGAQLRAKSALRDRLQAMLESRPGKLADVLAVEQELARVQGEIDAAQSELEVMRGRVQTSEMSVAYQSAGRAISGKAMEPLAKALTGAFSLLVMGFAAMVTIAAFGLPWLLVGGGVYWLWRRRKRRSAAKPSEPA